MSLIIILICLIAERFLLNKQALRQPVWFNDYSDWYHRQELPVWMRNGFGGVISLLLPPLLAVALLQQLFDDTLAGLPGALFACAVLLYSLGPDDLDQQISRFIDARDKGDEQHARGVARDLLNDEPPPHDPAYSQAVAESILIQANNRIFAVIFWFLVLGPIGALLYRLASRLPLTRTAGEDLDFHLISRQLVSILDWIPARITAFSYAIAGSFEDAMNGWRSYNEKRSDEFSDSASGILICTGSGALRLASVLDRNRDDTTHHLYLVEAAMSLVWRSLVVWGVTLGLFTFADWL
ncbi:MAG: regulatory signaling modulator protein AmpE [Chromatiales bacterium]|nr:regulatory signaling modulator protein AmpE [Gammaproteobacteria bacterium]